MLTFLHPVKKYPIIDDLALLLARIALGVILIAHGWQKFTEWTLAGTAAAFGDMGIPAPGITSTFAASAELVGGILLVVGLFAPLAAGLMLIASRGARKISVDALLPGSGYRAPAATRTQDSHLVDAS